jgi:basic membrane protein A
MKKIVLSLGVVLAAAFFSSCSDTAEAKPDGCRTRVGIVFDIGGKNDRSFNAAAWEGVKRGNRISAFA